MMWVQKHWRLVAGGIFTLLTGIAILTVIATFPPALPFFAGFVALSASAIIPIVTLIAMAVAAVVATLFNQACKWLSEVTRPAWVEGIVSYDRRTPRPEYFGESYFKPFVYSFLLGAAAFLVTGLVLLIGGAAFLSTPVWITAGSALAIGFGAGVLLHAAFFGSLRLDNYCEQKIAEVVPYSCLNVNPLDRSGHESGEDLDSSAAPSATPRRARKATPSSPVPGVSSETKSTRQSSDRATDLFSTPTSKRSPPPGRPNSSTLVPVTTLKPGMNEPSKAPKEKKHKHKHKDKDTHRHHNKREQSGSDASSQDSGSRTPPSPKAESPSASGSVSASALVEGRLRMEAKSKRKEVARVARGSAEFSNNSL